eukprot:6816247-Pyramimonas_sp.AAC.2
MGGRRRKNNIGSWRRRSSSSSSRRGEIKRMRKGRRGWPLGKARKRMIMRRRNDEKEDGYAWIGPSEGSRGERA